MDKLPVILGAIIGAAMVLLRKLKPKPKPRERVTEPNANLVRLKIVTSEKFVEKSIDPDLLDDLLYRLTESPDGAELSWRQRGGKNKGRIRSARYNHVVRVEQWIDGVWVEIYPKKG